MSKKVYGWGADNVFNFYDIVPDDYQLQANQTFDSPLVAKDGVATLNQPTKRVAGGWQQPTEEEHKAWIEANQKQFPQQKTEPAAPTIQDQLIASLSTDVAKQKVTQAAQNQIIATLSKDMANVKIELQKATDKTQPVTQA